MTHFLLGTEDEAEVAVGVAVGVRAMMAAERAKMAAITHINPQESSKVLVFLAANQVTNTGRLSVQNINRNHRKKSMRNLHITSQIWLCCAQRKPLLLWTTTIIIIKHRYVMRALLVLSCLLLIIQRTFVIIAPLLMCAM